MARIPATGELLEAMKMATYRLGKIGTSVTY
jgi:hypothetical protein